MAERALGIPQYTVKLPRAMDYAEGAALYLNYATAWFSLYRAGFDRGETVLVHGAAGGVGTATLQLVRALGGTSIAVVSSDEKENVARQAGANHVVRSTGGWVGRVRDLTDGRGSTSSWTRWAVIASSTLSAHSTSEAGSPSSGSPAESPPSRSTACCYEI